MGRAFRLAAIALLVALAVALLAPPACAHDDQNDLPIVLRYQPGNSIVEGYSDSFAFIMDKLWIFDYSYVTCAIDPSTTATKDVDFTITPFAGGYDDENWHWFTIHTIDDNRYDPLHSTINISVTLHVGYSFWWGLSDHDHVYWCNYTLIDNTSAVQFVPDLYTVSETDASVDLTVVRTMNRTSGLLAYYSTAGGSAAAGDYFEDSSGPVSFDPGVGGSETITIDLKNKFVNDSTPVSFYVNLSVIEGGVVLGSNATIVVNRNAPAGMFYLPQINDTVIEGNTINFTIKRSIPAGMDGSESSGAFVTFSTADVSALEGQDYDRTVVNLTFNHSETSKTVSVQTYNRTGNGGTRFFMVGLSGAGGGASLDPDPADIGYEAYILDNTPVPGVGFNVSESNVDEGNDLAFSIVLSRPSDIRCSINFSYLVMDSPARFTCSLDQGPVYFEPGVTSREVLVTVPFEEGVQAAQMVTFMLSGPRDLSIGTNERNSLTINNVPHIDTNPAVQFPATSAVIGWGTAGYGLAIWRSGTQFDSEVTFNVIGGDAVLDTDYTVSPRPGSPISFNPGEGTKTIEISVPSVLQGEKTLVLELAPVRNATLWPGYSTIALTLRDLSLVVTPTPSPVPPIDRPHLVLQVSVAPDTITPGAEAIITVTVTDGTTPVTGAGVSAVSSLGTLTPLSSQNANGKYFWKLRSDAPGPCTLSITATAEGYLPGTASATVQVVAAPAGSLGLNLAVTPDPVPAGSDAQVAVTVTADGRPLPDAIVNILSTGGTLDPPIGTTGQDGVFRANFRADAADTYVLTISATASGHPAASGSYGINVAEAASRHLYCTLNTRPQSIGPGGTADVTAMVTDGSGPVEGATVNISVTGGSIDPADGMTGPDGTFTARLIAGETGTYTLTAQATAPDSVPAGATALVDVRPGLIDAQLVLLALAALGAGAILLAGTILLVGRLREVSLKATPKIPYVQADGSSRLPVRVEAYNGFGKPRRMRRNTHVDMEVTAGKIDDIIIPAGKSFAEAVLTSSRDFGTVTVTARLGDRAVASTPVEFRLENGSLAVSVSPSSLIADSKSSATITVRVRNGKGQYVSPLEDRAVELATTLGDIIGSITTLQARAQSANARILSPGSIGVATVTATMGNLKGTGRVEFRGLPTRPCSQCGQPVASSATACPWCGKDLKPAITMPLPGILNG
jgi:hypothetical protein